MPSLSRAAIIEFLNIFAANPGSVSTDNEHTWRTLQLIASSDDFAIAMADLEAMLLQLLSHHDAQDTVSTLIFQALYVYQDYYMSDKRLPSEIAKELSELADALEAACLKIESIVTPRLRPSNMAYAKSRYVVPIEQSIISDAVSVYIYSEVDDTLYGGEPIGRLKVSVDIKSLQRIQKGFISRARRICIEMMRHPKMSKDTTIIGDAIASLHNVFVERNADYPDRKFAAIKNKVISVLVTICLDMSAAALNPERVRNFIYKTRRRQ